MGNTNIATQIRHSSSKTRESRDGRRRRIEAELIESGMKLFCEKGFENTTVIDIANAVGISRRTFFRYFKAKEDMVFFWLDEQGKFISKKLKQRPEQESAATSMAQAYLALVELLDRDNGEMLEQAQLIFAEPQLTRRYHEENIKWENRFSEIIAEHQQAEQGAYFDINVQVSCMTTAFVLAIRYWASSDKGSRLLPWVKSAFNAVTGEFPLSC